jgi:hypothetical protein
MKNTDTHRTATEAQIHANRENAKKSTGPRSAEGKAASSRNGLSHGLCADKHILPGEDPEEFLFFLKELFDQFRPVGQGEEKLVLRIAAAQWRLDRALPMEAGIQRECLRDLAEEDAYRQRTYAQEKENAAYRGEPELPAPAPPDERDRLARAFKLDCAGPNSFAKLTRYEGAIERSIDRSLRQLKAFQAARQVGQAEPQVGQALPPAETEPQVEQASPPAETAPEPPQTPSEPANCKANPNNEGIPAPMHNPAQAGPTSPQPLAPSPGAPSTPTPFAFADPPR